MLPPSASVLVFDAFPGNHYRGGGDLIAARLPVNGAETVTRVPRLPR